MIATSASIAQWILVPNLADFHSAHPDIGIRLITTVWPDDFLATSADIEIRFGTKEVVGKGANLIEPSNLCAVVSPQLFRQKREAFGPEMLRHFPLIQPVGISTQWAQVQQQLGMAQPAEPRTYVDTHGLAVDLAVAGAGIALTHGLIAAKPIADGRLLSLPIGERRSDEGYYLAKQTDIAPEAQAVFLAWFDRIIRQLSPHSGSTN